MSAVEAEEMERPVSSDESSPSLPPVGTIVTGTFTKDSADAQTGVAIRRKGGIIVITGILPDSLAATNTDLVAGLQVTSINDIDVTPEGFTAEQAAKLLVEPEGLITIVAVVPAQEEEQVKKETKRTPTTAEAISAKEDSKCCCLV